MLVTLPDEVCVKYLQMAQSQGRTLEEVLAAQLKRFDKLLPGTRAVVIPFADLKELEARIGMGSIADGSELVEKVKQLAGVSFCNLDIGLTHGQLKELEHRARKQGREVSELVEDIWKKLTQEFFYSADGGVKVSSTGQRIGDKQGDKARKAKETPPKDPPAPPVPAPPPPPADPPSPPPVESPVGG